MVYNPYTPFTGHTAPVPGGYDPNANPFAVPPTPDPGAYDPNVNPFAGPAVGGGRRRPGGSLNNVNRLRANTARLLMGARQRLGSLSAPLRGTAGAVGRFLGPVATIAGIGMQSYDTLTNQNENFDIGGQLAGNALGLAALPLLATPLAPLTPLVAGGLSYLGGEFGKRNLNLIPDDVNRQLRTEQQRLERTLQATSDPVVRQIAVQRSRERSNEILGAGGGRNNDRPETQTFETSSEVLTPSSAMSMRYDPNGIVQRGMDYETDRNIRQAKELGWDIHRRFMDAQRFTASSQQAMGMLDAAMADSDSHRRFLADIANSRIY